MHFTSVPRLPTRTLPAFPVHRRPLRALTEMRRHRQLHLHRQLLPTLLRLLQKMETWSTSTRSHLPLLVILGRQRAHKLLLATIRPPPPMTSLLRATTNLRPVSTRHLLATIRHLLVTTRHLLASVSLLQRMRTLLLCSRHSKLGSTLPLQTRWAGLRCTLLQAACLLAGTPQWLARELPQGLAPRRHLVLLRLPIRKRRLRTTPACRQSHSALPVPMENPQQ
mmetsp:Transcript_2535/g.9016  ORF Transcript_2535/g.9016 Transcript_2535/m.9016 type:complete len:223 (+) Transcript_2535:918-1586(+)